MEKHPEITEKNSNHHPPSPHGAAPFSGLVAARLFPMDKSAAAAIHTAASPNLETCHVHFAYPARLTGAAHPRHAEVAQGRVVTVSVEKMSFDKPVKTGDTICIHAELLRVGRSSLDIKLEVWARQLVGAYEAERQLVTEGVFRYVAVDEARQPREVPEHPLFFTRRPDGTAQVHPLVTT